MLNPFEDESSIRALEKERRYRNYSSDMEKILRQFENTSDWADTIPLLVRLTKTIIANRQYELIPHKLMLCKRLAQCLHQNMPSGVHEKTLECYSAVFSCVQRTDLKCNLHLYLFGLLPLFAYCGSTIRLPLISLYKEFVLPLGPALRPCLSGLLLALLPGMEETSDHVDRVGQLLRSISKAVSPPVFFTGLWRVLSDSPSVRLTGLNFVLACYDKRKSLDDQDDLMGQVLGNLMDSLCAVLADHNTLVQRQALEFLLNAFPLSTSRLGSDDLARLCAAAFNILLKRDASLNRRFYAWLLGNSPSGGGGGGGGVQDDAASAASSAGGGTASNNRFVGRSVCIAAYRIFAKQKAADPVPAFRVLQSLIERPVVGQQIVSDTLLTALRLWRDAPNPEDATASIGHLLSSLDGAFLCRFFADLLASDWSRCEELCSLARMAHNRCLANDWTPLLLRLLRLVTNRLPETSPGMLEAAIRLASELLASAASEPLDARIVQNCRLAYLRLCLTKLGLDRTVLANAPARLRSDSTEGGHVTLADSGVAFAAALESLLALLGRVAACPLRDVNNGLGIEDDSEDTNDEGKDEVDLDDEEENADLPAPRWVLALLVSSCFVRETSIRHPSTRALLELLAAAQCLTAADASHEFEADSTTADAPSNQSASAASTKVVAVSFPTLPPVALAWLQSSQLYFLLGEALWSDLAPGAEPADQRAAASLFAELCQSVPEICEDLLLRKLGSEQGDQADAHKRFASLWLLMKPDRAPQLPRCLLALLHFVGSGHALEKIVVDWAEHAMRMGQLHRLLNPLLALLLSPKAARLSVDRIAEEASAKNGSSANGGGGSAGGASTSRWDVEEARIVGIESDGTGKVIYRVNQSPARATDGTSNQQSSSLANPSSSGSSGTASSAGRSRSAVQLLATATSAAPVRLPGGGASSASAASFRLRINPLDEASVNETDTDSIEANSIEDKNVADTTESAAVSSSSNSNREATPTPPARVASSGVLCPSPEAVSVVNDIIEELITASLAQVERSVHPLFTHMCLYNRKIDCLQVSYVLSRLLALLSALPQLFTAKLAGTQLLPAKSPGSYQVFALFLRHRACVDGANFFQSYKSVTYLHLLTSLALDYVRSCYSPYARERVESPELIGNRLVQTRAADLLCSLAQCAASGDSPEAARQLRDNRLQFSRLALHCLCSALAACYSHWTVESHVFSARIVQFNEIGVGWLARAAHVKSLASLTLRLLALMKPSPMAGNASAADEGATKKAAGRSVSATSP
uniref:Dopey_N domain-containing protein n=1 Tax=Macrostomum lignano TaxID=282301 RepID=A0A1I8G8L0_9PLAT